MCRNASRTPRLRAAVLAVAAASAIGCAIDTQEAPPVSAPSGFALSLGVAVVPDVIPRDGRAISEIRLTARDVLGNPVGGQRLVVTVRPAGTLDASEVTTDAAGSARLRFTAPVVESGHDRATISVTPVGADRGTVLSDPRTAVITLSGPAVATPAFTFSPETPGQFDLVSFDASGTVLSGRACGDACTYAWDFGDGNSLPGASVPLASHRFEARGAFLVTLTTTANEIAVKSTRVIAVGAPKAITAVITVSPTNPHVNEQVLFSAASSTTPDGAAVVSYQWDFGNGESATGAAVATRFESARTYTVRLTITDEHGRTATTTVTVPVDES